ncbi:hypothetical protein [Halalkalibacter krulwichiae]|uniref:Salicylate hydroxylase n=1 Tax=Halalkalibacter krulwichiae TaxID=199441 RepID=A0A1X9M9K5_9BACI|nr:hypothetical protein [Halalkalibacter krulwichiae]ARK28853.1 salicylate hydroxylase [Halalkalibacter krulwichiae]
MKSKSELRVAIIGGRIGGAAAAVALQRGGIRAEIFEQAPVIKERGRCWCWNASSICPLFKKWGIYDEIESKSYLM